MENIKKIDNAGRLVLGKQFAGSFVSVDTSNPNEIHLKLVNITPKDESVRRTILTDESFSQLIDHLENPSAETKAFLKAKESYHQLKNN